MLHSQKYYLKIISKALYLLGLGDVWYERETKEKTPSQKVIYNLFFIVINITNYLLIINEMLAVMIIEDLNYYMQVTIAYVVIGLKAFIVHLRKDRIRIVLERLLESHTDLYDLYSSDKESVGKAKKYCYPLFIGVYSMFTLRTVNTIWAYFENGTPIKTLETLYPDVSWSGIFTNIIHFIVEVHCWYMVSVMVFIDSLCFCCLIFTQFKFRAVNSYFSSLRDNFQLRHKEQGDLERNFREDFVTGIKLHEDALWCARNIQSALGNMYDVQLLLSMTILALSMISILMSQRDVVTLISGLLSFLTVMILTSTYMFASGDITYEASLIPTTMFHSGWDLKSRERQFHVLLVVAMLRAQAPVRMRAFGVIHLSYESFILVLRSSYSCFALMY